jgi:hypothetical protein
VDSFIRGTGIDSFRLEPFQAVYADLELAWALQVRVLEVRALQIRVLEVRALQVQVLQGVGHVSTASNRMYRAVMDQQMGIV